MSDESRSWPRLSGELWYGPPHFWELRQDGDVLEIVPSQSSRGLEWYFIALAVLSVIVAIIVVGMIPSPNLLGVAAVTTGLALSFLLCRTLIRVKRSVEQTKGPILQISIENRLVRLPRINKSWPLDQVVKWEIVYGTRLKEMDGDRHRTMDSISEFQMIIECDDGHIEVWPIIGAQWHKDRELLSAAHAISEITALPCVVTNNDITSRLQD